MVSHLFCKFLVGKVRKLVLFQVGGVSNLDLLASNTKVYVIRLTEGRCNPLTVKLDETGKLVQFHFRIVYYRFIAYISETLLAFSLSHWISVSGCN